ncbi:MAG: AAA family ATPase, partial [Armatimonadetes bacterium]|nr:AAA family ATPase [Armatimonadota bacterium]
MQTGQRAPKAISYSEFQALIRQDRIAEVVFEEENKLIGKYKETAGAEAAEAKPKEFFTYFPPDASAEVVKFLNDYPDVKQISKPVNKTEWWLYVMNILPYLLLFGFFILIMRQAQSSGGQAFSFGRSKHKLVSENRVKVTFDDVAGVTEAKEELSEVVDYLKFPKKYQSLGARIPKGVLLLGAPGTGKTLLGRAVAGEAGVPFYYISGSDFVEMFVGVGASRVRDLFEQGKKHAPCIIFMDEIDA